MSEQNDSAPEQSSNRQTSEQPSDRAADARPWLASRRRVLQSAAGAGGLAAFGSFGTAQDTQTIELGGVTSGWQGRAPPEIEGETNPTLQLTEGQTYELTWENVDGLPHNVVILDGDGNELERTEIISGEGETQTLEFDASSEMAQYLCEVHPNTMVGDIEVGSGDGGQQDAAAGPQFFQQGAEVGVQTVAEGMTAPTDFAVAQGDQDRFYVADQTGEVWVVTSEGRREEPFLDVSDRMVTLGEFNGQYADQDQDYDERGLLGIDFHPDYRENGRFYVHYSAPPNEQTPENWDHVEVVSEFAVSDDGRTADPESERRLLELQSPQYNHDSGPMAFGPDGNLYVPMGDGGGANDDMYGHVDDWYDDNAGGNGQDVSENLLGSVLRINVDEQAGDKPYQVPADNPLVDVQGGLGEHYAWGFRNPFGISFDSDDRMFVADAGQDLFEEVDIVERGGNYGWNVKEGTHCFSTENPSEPPASCPDQAPNEPPYDGQELQDPIVEYPHVYQGQSVGIVIVGGHFYENNTVPNLQNKYIFGEWSNDPARREPAGRLLAATDPEASGAAGGGGTGMNASADRTTGANATGNESTPANATTGDEPVAEEAPGKGSEDEMAPNRSAGDQTGGNATAENQTAGGQADDGEQIVPRDELWNMEELVIANSDNGKLGHFVRQFGQDNQGEVYVLANREGTPTGDTGVVMKLVPPQEGEGPPEGEREETGPVAEEAPQKGADNQSAPNETDVEVGENATNASGGNVTDAVENDTSATNASGNSS